MSKEYTYCEISVGGLHNRGNIVNVGNSMLNMSYYGKEVVDGYHSAYMHAIDFYDHVAANGTVSGYDGPSWTDNLFWDIDGETLDQSLLGSRELVRRLLSDFHIEEGAIRVYFSGRKGFHVILPTKDTEPLAERGDKTPSVIKSVCSCIASGIECVDGVIYDRTRLIRTPNSKHGKSGLYKIPVGIEDLMTRTSEYISREASAQKQLNAITVWSSNGKLQDLIADAISDSGVRPRGNATITASELHEGIAHGFSKGRRNSGLTAVAGMLHRRNIDKSFTQAILTAINGNFVDPLSEKDVARIVDSVERYHVDSRFIEPKESDIITMSDAAQSYIDLRSRIDRMSYGKEFEHLARQLPFFDPGDVLLICGRAGIGKTTFGMQVNNEIAKHCKARGLTISLEMARHFLFLRAACIEANRRGLNATATDVSKLIMDKNDIVQATKNNWSNMLLVDRDSLSLEQIEDYYLIAQDRCGTLSNLLIDYGGLIRGGDDYNGVSKIARSLKGLAKRLNTRLSVVVQLSRAAGDGTMPVKMDMLRDSGAWEEGADYIYGGWLSKTSTNRIHMCSLKNRWLSERNAMFDIINTGLYYETTDYVADSYSQEGNTERKIW